MRSEDVESTLVTSPMTLASGGARNGVQPLLLSLAVLAGLFALAILLQYLNGAFRVEFGSYPDEPAHYVTSLMVREYITGPNPLSPLKFAEQYYHHYPKVAFGHWPPVFYVVQALWMLLFSASRASVRLELAFTTALVAFSLWHEARRWFGRTPAILAAALLVCVPLFQRSTDEEMAETLLVLFCFWSAIYFGRYLESNRTSDSLWFGLYFSLAVLTKGSGWLLALIPPIVFVLTRRFQYLRERSFWAGVLLIAVLCLPWQLITLRSAERGWTGGSHPSLGYTFDALAQFLWIFISILGPILSVVIVIGVFTEIALPILSRPLASVSVVMFSLILADWLFHALVPAGVEDRKMIMAVPALIYFLFVGGFWLSDRLPSRSRFSSWRRPLIAIMGILVFAEEVFAVPRSDYYGYSGAARYIVSDSKLDRSTLLVSSGSIGEGLLISEVAMREPRPQITILRATKELAKVDWTGAHYRSLFTTPQELLAYLRRARVNAIVLDTYPGQASFSHQALMERTIGERPTDFALLSSFSGEVNKKKGKVEIFQVISAPKKPAE